MWYIIDCVIEIRWLSYYRVLLTRQVFVGMSLIGILCGYLLKENDIYKHQIASDKPKCG